MWKHYSTPLQTQQSPTQTELQSLKMETTVTRSNEMIDVTATVMLAEIATAIGSVETAAEIEIAEKLMGTRS